MHFSSLRRSPLPSNAPKNWSTPPRFSRGTQISNWQLRLKTSHNSDNSSDPKSTANNTSNATEQYDPNPSPHPGPSYQPTPFSIWLKRSSSHTPPLSLPTPSPQPPPPPPPPPPPRPLNTSAPLLDERPNLLKKILISLQAAPKGQSQVRHLERFSCLRLQRKLLVSDPGIHHGTCVTHVPWCMLGSLTSFSYHAAVHGATCCLPLTRPSGRGKCFAGSPECLHLVSEINKAKTKLECSPGQARHFWKKSSFRQIL